MDYPCSTAANWKMRAEHFMLPQEHPGGVSDISRWYRFAQPPANERKAIHHQKNRKTIDWIAVVESSLLVETGHAKSAPDAVLSPIGTTGKRGKSVF